MDVNDPRYGAWRPNDQPSGPVNGGASPPPPVSRTDAMRGICFCLLYDLCCWLAAVRRAVPGDVDEYTLTTLRDIGDPRQRLGRYLSAAVLESWERALQPFFAAGLTLEPELGESGSFQERGRDAGGRIQAELRFGNRSSILDRGQRRHQLPPHDWVLTVWLAPDLGGYVENASIRRA
jgi:hypothetical protein